MAWMQHYHGDGTVRRIEPGPPPPWRAFPREPLGLVFQPPDKLVDAVNAALCLSRPLLITGNPGSGKSTVVDSVAAELDLGEVIRWHITSRSTLTDGLYRYDALGRIHNYQLTGQDDISEFVRLGPLGSAFVERKRPDGSTSPRALLIDEIDKSDLDLAGDLLDVLEQGDYEIPELARHQQSEVSVRLWKSRERHLVREGRVVCTSFPFIVMTSNGERDFPPPFLRRCVRFEMPVPNEGLLAKVVEAHLRIDAGDPKVNELIDGFMTLLRQEKSVAIDQLLGAIFLLTGPGAPTGERREEIRDRILRDLRA
jgi:MoxR-like ATPase